MSSDAPPRVVLSLDFELRWGLHDVLGADRDAYRASLEGTREVVPRLLRMLTERGVSATWACVGALACAGWEDYLARAPAPPEYAAERLRFDLRWSEWDPEGALHFAPELVAAVARTPGQELGSHTFSHLFLGEAGVMRRDARADAAATRALFEERFGVRPRSLVFPRNQVCFTDVLASEGIRVVRTNPPAWYWSRTLTQDEVLPLRVARLIDSVDPLTRRAAPPRVSRVVETIGSVLLRVSAPEPVFRAVQVKLAREARRLRGGDVLHLWLHPHNLGAAPGPRLARMEALLDTVARHAPRETAYRSMGELA
ncbi:MAG: polysaccharide deacetylase family protein [Sandaracinaceae bacterium]|nr:polysaccharide deacetylase family protein [Sandaracinaceae bacterium]